MSIRFLQRNLVARHNQLLRVKSNGQPLERSQVARVILQSSLTCDLYRTSKLLSHSRPIITRRVRVPLDTSEGVVKRHFFALIDGSYRYTAPMPRRMSPMLTM